MFVCVALCVNLVRVFLLCYLDISCVTARSCQCYAVDISLGCEILPLRWQRKLDLT